MNHKNNIIFKGILLVFSVVGLVLFSFSCSKDKTPMDKDDPDSKTVRIATFNIQVGIGAAWEARKLRVAKTIAINNFDLFGVQEALPGQMDFLKVNLKDFDYVGIGRDAGDQGEHSAIFFNTLLFTLIGSDTFWLSETPSIASKGWDADLNRICTWGKFKEKASGKIFYVFNTHFDHIGIVARRKSAELILQKITEIAEKNVPVIFTGDLNFDELNANYTLLNNSNLIKDSFLLADRVLVRHGTFHGYKPPPYGNRIDHIFVKPGSFHVQRHSIFDEKVEGDYPSDHFPVYVDLSFK